MKQILTTLAILLLMPLMLWAASVPTITKQYKDIPLSEVLSSLEKKTHCTIVYNPQDVDGQRPITANYKDMNILTAVRRLFGDAFDVKYKNQIITVTRKAEQPQPQPQSQSQPQPQQSQPQQAVEMATTSNGDRVMQLQQEEYVSRWDTVISLQQKQVRRPAYVQPEPYFAHCSHLVCMGLGVGYGEVKQYGHVAAQGDLSYAFFFSDNWGLSLGFGVDYYHTQHHYDASRSVPQYTDTDLEPEGELRIQERNMTHDMRLLTLNVPIMLQMQYPVWIRSTRHAPINGLSVYAAAGVRIGYPYMHNYTLTGEREQSCYYSEWNLELHDLHEFGTSQVDERGDFAVKKPTIAPQAELGFAIPMNTQQTMYLHVGIYGNAIVNATEGGMLPWQVGAKIGLCFRQPAKTKPRPTVYRSVVEYDTVYNYIEHIDTIRTYHYDTIPAAKKIAQVVETSIIWFDLNDVTPKVEPADMLDRIAAILVEHPEQRIEVNGHTCDLGKKEYNEKLSQQRAQAVVDLLIAKGVKKTQLVVHAYANSKPYYSKSHDRVLDRRVEIVPIIGRR